MVHWKLEAVQELELGRHACWGKLCWMEKVLGGWKGTWGKIRL